MGFTARRRADWICASGSWPPPQPPRAGRRRGSGPMSPPRSAGWPRLRRPGPCVAARPQGRARRLKLKPHEAFLRGLIDEKDDITLEEMRARLLDEHDLMVGIGTLWIFLDAQHLTYIKMTAHATEQSRPDVKAEREVWFKGQLDRTCAPRVPRRDLDLGQNGPLVPTGLRAVSGCARPCPTPYRGRPARRSAPSSAPCVDRPAFLSTT